MYSDVKLTTLYDVLHDALYRKTWDPSMLDGQEICRINDNNDIGYYASTYLSDCVPHIRAGFNQALVPDVLCRTVEADCPTECV